MGKSKAQLFDKGSAADRSLLKCGRTGRSQAGNRGIVSFLKSGKIH